MGNISDSLFAFFTYIGRMRTVILKFFYYYFRFRWWKIRKNTYCRTISLFEIVTEKRREQQWF